MIIDRTTMNGIVKEQHRSPTPSSHLGKRKRSASPAKVLANGSASLNPLRAHSNIDNIIREVKQ